MKPYRRHRRRSLNARASHTKPTGERTRPGERSYLRSIITSARSPATPTQQRRRCVHKNAIRTRRAISASRVTCLKCPALSAGRLCVAPPVRHNNKITIKTFHFCSRVVFVWATTKPRASDAMGSGR